MSAPRPRLLDLFCGAGGASMGYHRAGFEVVGVDIAPQPHYPFEFHEADAMTYPLDGFDAVHASPPCQRYSLLRRGLWQDRDDHPDLIAATRERIQHLPYVIENVPGAKAELRSPLMLCGTMFGLGAADGYLRRHRLFEGSTWLWAPAACAHPAGRPMRVHGGGTGAGDYHVPPRANARVIGVYGHAGGRSVRDGLSFQGMASRREAMGIDWMTSNELSESIPPAYTEWIGAQLLAALGATAVAP